MEVVISAFECRMGAPESWRSAGSRRGRLCGVLLGEESSVPVVIAGAQGLTGCRPSALSRRSLGFSECRTRDR
jgi:hypothetical protein